jgi:hypothetical protein
MSACNEISVLTLRNHIVEMIEEAAYWHGEI